MVLLFGFVAPILTDGLGDHTSFIFLTIFGTLPNYNGIVLKDSGKKKFLKNLEDRMKQTIKHSGIKKQTSYRRLIRLELYKLEKHFMGEEVYKPFVMDW